jgi:hypothetical protein
MLRGPGVPSPFQQPQFPGAGDRPVAGGDTQLAVSRLHLRRDGGYYQPITLFALSAWG